MSLYRGFENEAGIHRGFALGGVANKEGRFQIRAFGQKVLDQRVRLQALPLISGGAVPEGLQGISDCHDRVNHRYAEKTGSTIKPATLPLRAPSHFFQGLTAQV